MLQLRWLIKRREWETWDDRDKESVKWSSDSKPILQCRRDIGEQWFDVPTVTEVETEADRRKKT